MSQIIFISYRRKESLVEARAVYERLRGEFGIQNVFIDLEGIAYGVDFVDAIEQQLSVCAIMLALIGPTWISGSAHSGRSLADDDDLVRIELRTALARAVHVVPVLVNGATMPSSNDLPDDLKALSRRQALELDFRRFDADMGRLVVALRRVLKLSVTAKRGQHTRTKKRSTAPPVRPKVFLSYPFERHDFYSAISKVIQTDGFCDIETGRDLTEPAVSLREQIKDRILRSHGFVAVWSERASKPWMLWELGVAQSRGIPVCLLVHKNHQDSAHLQIFPELHSIQFRDTDLCELLKSRWASFRDEVMTFYRKRRDRKP